MDVFVFFKNILKVSFNLNSTFARNLACFFSLPILSVALLACKINDNRISGSIGSSPPSTPSEEAPPATPPPSPATSISYSFGSVVVFGEAIAIANPVLDGAVESYSVNPAFPAGMILNPITGQVSGTPNELVGSVTYTITANTSNGPLTSDLTFGVAQRLTINDVGNANVGDDNPGDGSCSAIALGTCTLRAAVEEAAVDNGQLKSIIEIPTGTHVIETSELNLSTPMDFIGSGIDVAIVEGHGINTTRIFYAPAGSKTIYMENFTVQNGVATDGFGGGAFGAPDFSGVNLVLESMKFFNNSCALSTQNGGGAILANMGNLVMKNSIIDNNTGPTTGGGSSLGGGGIQVKGGNTNIEDSVITNNTTDFNGGGLDANSRVTIRRTTISGNTSNNFGGGGININSSNCDNNLIEDSLISGNFSTNGNGGGIKIGNCSMIFYPFQVVNSTIAGNSANSGAFAVRGGGIYSNHNMFGGNTLEIINSTIANNFAKTSGRAIFSEGFSSIFYYKNTIIAGNTGGGNQCAGNFGGTHVSLGANIESTNTCNFNLVNDKPSTDPLLGALQDNGGPTYTLLPGAPAKDAGEATFCTSADQRGLPRPGTTVGDIQCDIGAVELQNGE